MDTSEIYMKMCEKAWPYLKEHKIPFNRQLRMLKIKGERLGAGYYEGIPLWEQDQLQEMLPEDHIIKLENLVDWLCDGDWDGGFFNDYAESFTSREQLELAFVMKEKYQKRWDGENWIKEEQ